jgi:hypothetical protein
VPAQIDVHGLQPHTHAAADPACTAAPAASCTALLALPACTAVHTHLAHPASALPAVKVPAWGAAVRTAASACTGHHPAGWVQVPSQAHQGPLGVPACTAACACQPHEHHPQGTTPWDTFPCPAQGLPCKVYCPYAPLSGT